MEKTKEEKTAKVGSILATTWGYSMTIVDFCQVVAVSPSGKTVKCRMIGMTERPDGYLSGEATPKRDHFLVNSEFRLHKREHCDMVWYVGSYPYCEKREHNSPQEPKHKGYFRVVDDNARVGFNHCD